MSEQSIPTTELSAFHQFLGEKLLQEGYTELTPEQSVDEFRAYQRDVERLRNELVPGLEQVQRGEAREIDLNQFLAEGRQRLAEKGVKD